MKIARQLIPVYLGSLTLCLSTNFVSAGNPLPNYYQDSGLSAFHSTVNHNLDEHIDPFTGMLQLHHVDTVLPGDGGFDLLLQRSFNSPTSTFGSVGDTTSYNKTPNIGVGWTLLIGGRLWAGGSGNSYACGSGAGTQMVFETPDGGRQALVKRPSGTPDFISAARWRAICLADGSGVEVFAPNGTQYYMRQAIFEGIPNASTGDSFFYPTQIVDRNGNTATFTYGTQTGVIVLNAISTSDGRNIGFYYTQYGAVQLLDHITAQQSTWTFQYQQPPVLTNFSGQGVAYLLASVYPPAGLPWNYSYITCPSSSTRGACSIQQFRYPEGATITYGYDFVDFHDGTGNTSVVISKQLSTGGTWGFSYAPGGSYDTTTVTLPSGIGTITYKHFGFGSVQSPNLWKIGLLAERDTGNIQTETYTWQGQQISTTPTNRGNYGNDGATYAPLLTARVITRDGFQYTTNYGFDLYGNPTTIAEVGQRNRTIARGYCQYDTPSRWIINVVGSETDSMGTIQRGFDGNCNLTSETRYGVNTGFSYYGNGNIHTRTDANGHMTTFSNYAYGVAGTESRPENVTITRSIDSRGNITAQTDGIAANNYIYGYDGLRRLTSLATPSGSSTTIGWTGNTTRTATRAGYSETLTLDLLGNPSNIRRDNVTTQFSYDALSRKTFESLPGSTSGTQMARDILGRVYRITNSDNTTRSFSYSSNVVTATDERQKQTIYHYESFGDPDQKFLTRIDLPTANNIVIARDNLGNLQSVAQGGFSRTYNYNGSYFLTSIADPETGTTTFGRDSVGNMTSSRVGSSPTTTFIPDNLNRLHQINYPNGNTVTINYYNNGKISSVTNNVTSRTYVYDGNANLQQETLTVDGRTFTINYNYDSKDALLSVTYPAPQIGPPFTADVITYNPNNLGRPAAALPFVNNVSYFNSGNVYQIGYQNGVVMTLGENSRNWPNSITAPFLSRGYVYDNAGNLYQINDAQYPALSMTLGYDDINELTSVSGGPWLNASMSYDAVGNIRTYNIGNTLRNYSYGSDNKLSTFNSQSFGYDVYGNVTSDALHTFQYDDASNLTSIDYSTSSQISYVYDGNNRRVSRTQNGVTTYYVHASNGDLLVEYTPGVNIVEHFYLQGKRIATKNIH